MKARGPLRGVRGVLHPQHRGTPAAVPVPAAAPTVLDRVKQAVRKLKGKAKRKVKQ